MNNITIYDDISILEDILKKQSNKTDLIDCNLDWKEIIIDTKNKKAILWNVSQDDVFSKWNAKHNFIYDPQNNILYKSLNI
jgi:hypothetical protein